ncbi:MAG: hypothetical protein HGA25_00640 [Clostridiales bacterium]|nr:hypothetical protein [Clostridiales bacterium]
MKAANIFKLILVTGISVTLVQSVFATDLDSASYKIVGATTSAGGALLDSSSGNYSLTSTAGNISANPRNYSSNYRLQQDPSVNFIAAQPGIQCFETTTDGSTSCLTGPAELSGGMVALCGTGGCYDKARFEVITNSNPSDTLYTIAKSTDNFVNDIQYIDGATFRPEAVGNHDINDFRTQAYWEAEVFNIKALASNTLYSIKISALQGDFTQSDYSKTSSTTTGIGSIFFDIDIASSGGTAAESSSPYTVAFSGADDLVGGAAATTAPNLVWLDIDSNSSGGVAVVQFGKNGGLHSATTTQTITSATANLDTSLEGFGLQSFYVYNDTSGFLGDLTAEANYAGSLNTVGAITTTANKIYDGDGPISNGRVGMYLIAKAGTNKTPATDYSEEIYFVLVPRY